MCLLIYYACSLRCGYFAGALLNGRELFEEGFGLRREVCAEMVRRREEIEPFIPGLFDAYVSNMSLEGIWGGKTSTGVTETAHPLSRAQAEDTILL